MSAIRTRGQQGVCSSPGGGLRASPHRVSVDLSPGAVEQIASRVAVLLQERERVAEPQLLSAGELARHLRVERPWVYRHRQLLGGLRIGTGPKAPWRFDYETAVEALRGRQTQQPIQQSNDTRRTR